MSIELSSVKRESDELDLTVRSASPLDAAACAAIYALYVSETVISFEAEAPSEDEMARRIADAVATHAWLVADVDREVVGYAYGHAFAPRAAYRWSTETSVYLARERRGQGIGRALYEALFDRLAARGYWRAFAGIALPNDASVGLHDAAGFEPAGIFRRVGWKHGAWHDVAWFQKDIGVATDPPTQPE
jgi:L-amino acid N-acyltransferase YncA